MIKSTAFTLLLALFGSATIGCVDQDDSDQQTQKSTGDDQDEEEFPDDQDDTDPPIGCRASLKDSSDCPVPPAP